MRIVVASIGYKKQSRLSTVTLGGNDRGGGVLTLWLVTFAAVYVSSRGGF